MPALRARGTKQMDGPQHEQHASSPVKQTTLNLECREPRGHEATEGEGMGKASTAEEASAVAVLVVAGLEVVVQVEVALAEAALAEAASAGVDLVAEASAAAARVAELLVEALTAAHVTW